MDQGHLVCLVVNKEGFLEKTIREMVRNERKNTILRRNTGNKYLIIGRKAQKAFIIMSFSSQVQYGFVQQKHRLIRQTVKYRPSILISQTDKAIYENLPPRLVRQKSLADKILCLQTNALVDRNIYFLRVIEVRPIQSVSSRIAA